ncbi:Hypothetical protein GbCGDNIH9_8627 [Granulibacter bethesdensis]|uniref:Uncharacterized protein n=1 Tax=Granulibacter bethesdensis TaxID=364410 RepID=A0AAC9K7Q0_9PROT|nr:Hypothetical protein GbCGDNIH9_8627 [Granulibacter bethesdensis]APH62577.1 Hypothetical protein GbCGDNIH8_8627 [Granulibacter bethesdensis]
MIFSSDNSAKNRMRQQTVHSFNLNEEDMRLAKNSYETNRLTMENPIF